MIQETADINELIIRYLDGSATLDEKILLLRWLKSSDENRNDFIHTRDLWLSCNVAVGNELEVDIALEKMKNRILQEQVRAYTGSGRKVPYTLLYRGFRVAAILLLLLSVGYGLGFWKGDTSRKLLVQKELITAKGSKGNFTLPDGTSVWLNSESKLTYPESFDGNKREVALEGEAYFEVTKDKKKPFIVKTGEIDIEVLGTSFNVDNYASNEFVQTALLSGSVKISGNVMEKTVCLKPNDLFLYNKSEHKVTVNKVKARLYADWIKDRLTFDNDYLSDILISMEGRYNITIECPAEFASNTRMSFTIRQENIQEILEAMSYIAPIKYELKNGKAYIIPK